MNNEKDREQVSDRDEKKTMWEQRLYYYISTSKRKINIGVKDIVELLTNSKYPIDTDEMFPTVSCIHRY
jgi:hypothetical protein